MIKKNRSSMNVRKRLLPPKERAKVAKEYRKKIGKGSNPYSPTKTGKKQIILGKARGISGKKPDHGGLTGRGITQVPGRKGVPAGIRIVPKDTYKRKKK